MSLAGGRTFGCPSGVTEVWYNAKGELDCYTDDELRAMNERRCVFVPVDDLAAIKNRLLDRKTMLETVDKIANATTFDLYDHQIEEIVDAVVEYALGGATSHERR